MTQLVLGGDVTDQVSDGADATSTKSQVGDDKEACREAISSTEDATDYLVELGMDISDDSLANDPEEGLLLRYLAATRSEEWPNAANGKNSVDDPGGGRAEIEHTLNLVEIEDYAHELAFLPDLTEVVTAKLDYDGSNVNSSSHTTEHTGRLAEVLKKHEGIMISSGNVLPPPAYGVVCGVDIGLCIDYKLVKAIAAIIEYAMPLIDDLLTELDAYLWFCSLDAASGFWAVMMPRRARQISDVICALGHFEWLRMPFGLKNAPMIYQRLIDNDLWGYVQPQIGWRSFARRVHQADLDGRINELTEKHRSITCVSLEARAAVRMVWIERGRA